MARRPPSSSPRPRSGPPTGGPANAGRSPQSEGRRGGPRAGPGGGPVGTPGGAAGPSGLWFFGRHPVMAALANPRRRCLELRTLDPTEPAILAGAEHRGCLIRPIDRAGLDSLLPPGAVHQGLALRVAPLPPLDLDDLVADEGIGPGAAQGSDPMVVAVLDQVSDPHNVGAILRSAAAFGLAAVLVQDRHSPEETGTLAKSASGALEHIPVVRLTNLARGLDRLKDLGFWCLGLAGEAPQTLAEVSPPPRVALVLGSEGSGLRRLVRERCDHLVRLPIRAEIESLNVSNAAAVAFYDLTTRGAPGGGRLLAGR